MHIVPANYHKLEKISCLNKITFKTIVDGSLIGSSHVCFEAKMTLKKFGQSKNNEKVLMFVLAPK